MRTETFKQDIHLPSAAEFVAKYPTYSVANGTDRALYDALATKENVVRAQAVTDTLELPAVAAVADVYTKACGGQRGLTGFRKQMAGAIVCMLMEANQYRKKNLKRAIPQRGWSRGEVYEPV